MKVGTDPQTEIEKPREGKRNYKKFTNTRDKQQSMFSEQKDQFCFPNQVMQRLDLYPKT